MILQMRHVFAEGSHPKRQFRAEIVVDEESHAADRAFSKSTAF